jgi:hypothetical protein
MAEFFQSSSVSRAIAGIYSPGADPVAKKIFKKESDLFGFPYGGRGASYKDPSLFP